LRRVGGRDRLGRCDGHAGSIGRAARGHGGGETGTPDQAERRHAEAAVFHRACSKRTPATTVIGTRTVVTRPQLRLPGKAF
jgi:hypothetical protein